MPAFARHDAIDPDAGSTTLRRGVRAPIPVMPSAVRKLPVRYR